MNVVKMPEVQNEESNTKKRREWQRITALGMAVIYSLMGWLRLRETLRYWHYLRSLRLYPGPLYLAVSGGMVGLLFTVIFFLILFRSRISTVFTRITSFLFLLWWWADRIWLGTREAFVTHLSTSVLITVLSLLFAFLLVRPYKTSEERIRL